jgi:putative membrane protein
MQQGKAPETAHRLLRDTGHAGIGMVALGLMLLVWSIYRYWRVGEDIERGEYIARQKGTLVASIGLLALGGLTALWLFLF